MPQSKFSQTIDLKAMAGQIGQVAKRGGLHQLPIDSIYPNPDQPRKHFDQASLEELAESLRCEGQISPILVRPLGPGTHQIVAGERRWRAARLAGWTHIAAIVADDTSQSDENSDAVRGLIENLHRDDLTPLDEIVAVGQLVSRIGVEQTAQRLVKNAAWVSKRNRVATSETFVMDFVRSGAVRDLEALYELAKLAQDDEAKARSLVTDYSPEQPVRLRDQIRALSPGRPQALRLASEPDGLPGGGPTADRGAQGSDEQDSEDETEDPNTESEDDGEGRGAGDDEFRRRNSSPAEPHVRFEREERQERDEDEESDEEGASAKRPADAPSSPMVIHAALRRAGVLVFMTDLGQVPFEVSDKAREQLLDLLQS